MPAKMIRTPVRPWLRTPEAIASRKAWLIARGVWWAREHDFAPGQSEDDETPFPFLKLPPELRNAIYRELLGIKARNKLWIHVLAPNRFALGSKHRPEKRLEVDLKSLLLVSKQFYLEVGTLFYRDNKFTFGSFEAEHSLKKWLPSPSKKSTMNLPVPILPTARDWITEVCVDFNLSNTWSTYENMAKGIKEHKGLKKLTVLVDQKQMLERFEWSKRCNGKAQSLPGYATFNSIHTLEKVEFKGKCPAFKKLGKKMMASHEKNKKKDETHGKKTKAVVGVKRARDEDDEDTEFSPTLPKKKTKQIKLEAMGIARHSSRATKPIDKFGAWKSH